MPGYMAIWIKDGAKLVPFLMILWLTFDFEGLSVWIFKIMFHEEYLFLIIILFLIIKTLD